MILLTSLVFDMFIEFVAASDLGAIVMWLSDMSLGLFSSTSPCISCDRVWYVG